MQQQVGNLEGDDRPNKKYFELALPTFPRLPNLRTNVIIIL